MQTEPVRRYARRFVARRAWEYVLNRVFLEERPVCTMCLRPMASEWSSSDVEWELTEDGSVAVSSEIALRLCFSCRQDLSLVRLSPHSRRLKLRPPVPVVSAVAHDGFMRTAIRQWKYDGGIWWTTWFAQLAAAAGQRSGLGPFDVVVPVPTTRDRYRKRGYHHTKLLADEIAQSLRIVTQNWLVRDSGLPADRITQSQTAKSANARRDGLKGQYRATMSSLPDLRVLLVDDVVTTGATLYACAEALQAAGAGRVTAMTVAYVL